MLRVKPTKLIGSRALRLKMFVLILAVCTMAFLTYTMYRLTWDFQQARNWSEFWHVEWEAGRVFTRVLGSGLFHFFLLAMGWSAYFRFRQQEMINIRLRRSEQKFRAIINHAGEAVFLLDDKGLVREWNKAAEQLFGFSRRQVMQVSFETLDTGLDLDLRGIFADVQRVRRSLTYELQQIRAGAGPQILSTTFSFIAPGIGILADKKGSFVVIARDITSEKQLESRMSETEKLAGIGQLAAGIAHQLNTPLGSILLSAQMLEETIEDDDDTEDIRRIIRQTEQCRGIIKGLLNFARPTGSGRTRVNMTEVINDTIYLLDKNLKVAGVQVEVEETCDPWVFGNRNELEQVFFNLLGNSLDAMQDGGEIQVKILPGDPGEVRVRFHDSGEGISEEDRDKVFLPFYTTKDYGKGTGLGLSIVARIVHEHGGRIELDSQKGRGTTFLLTFSAAHDRVGQTSLIDDTGEE